MFNMFCTTAGVVKLVTGEENNVWPLVRIYRGGFLLIEFLFYWASTRMDGGKLE